MIPHLNELFEAGKKWLVVTGDQAFIAADDAEFGRTGGPGHVAFAVLDLQKAYLRFEALADRESYTLPQLAMLAGVTYPTARVWTEAGVLLPTAREGNGAGSGKERLFSRADAFAARVAGTLRHAGVRNLMLLAKITAFASGRASLAESKA